MALVTACASPAVQPCTTLVPTQNLAGADGRTYRVDTYVTVQATQSGSGGSAVAGRNVKLVSILIRETATPWKIWARTSSSFDLSTGQ